MFWPIKQFYWTIYRHEWERVNQLQNKKDSLLDPSQSQLDGMEIGDENADEEAIDENLDMDAVLDWRSKQLF